MEVIDKADAMKAIAKILSSDLSEKEVKLLIKVKEEIMAIPPQIAKFSMTKSGIFLEYRNRGRKND